MAIGNKMHIFPRENLNAAFMLFECERRLHVVQLIFTDCTVDEWRESKHHVQFHSISRTRNVPIFAMPGFFKNKKKKKQTNRQKGSKCERLAMAVNWFVNAIETHVHHITIRSETEFYSFNFVINFFSFDFTSFTQFRSMFC